MTGRLKRRSSIGLAASRREMESNASDENEDNVDEEAERRARNMQRRQQQQANHLDSPSVGQDKGNSRRSIGGLSGLTATQLAEHYNNCIKLSAENKISTKNAFNLQLIDYMATMIKKKESEMSNFQVAAGTLDASTKIYAYRVDAVYGDTLKIASGLGQSKKQADDTQKDIEMNDPEGEEQIDNNNPDKKVRKRIKRSHTIEKNLKNLNVNKFELEFDVDPLFKKTSSQFDGATGGNQFLSTLEVRDETGELLLDSESRLEANSKQVEDVDCEIEVSPLTVADSMLTCSTFSQFSFTTWSLDSDDDDDYNRLNESISASQEERQREQEEIEQEHAFDALAVPEPVDDGGMYDEGGVDGDYDDDTGEYSERAIGHAANVGSRGFTATLPMTTTDMLSALTTAPLEYSYFDHGKLGAWAGPKHWKFKPLSRPTTDTDKAKGRKKKEIQRIEFNEKEDETYEKMMRLLSKPKKPIELTDKTMKSWKREKTTLPEDLHYSGHQLVRLKVCDQIIVAGRKTAAETQVDDVDDYDYNNAADRDDYCPDVDDDNDAYEGDFTGGLDDNGENNFDKENLDSSSRLQADYGGEDLVEAPKMVDKAALQIGYAKTAKKVDMKRIKAVTWNILTQASNEDKENVGASPEKVQDKSKSDGKVEETTFSHVYRLLKQPHRLPSKMTENLSVPLAFLALLHLCNEENLEIVPETDLTDFAIKQG